MAGPSGGQCHPTAAIRAHDHAIKNRLVSLNQKEESRNLHVERMRQVLCASYSDHARVGERVRGPRLGRACGDLLVTRIKIHRCDACKNGLVERSRGFFCQLTHPLHPRDGGNLNFADHARLGERVRERRHRAPPRWKCASAGAEIRHRDLRWDPRVR